MTSRWERAAVTEDAAVDAIRQQKSKKFDGGMRTIVKPKASPHGAVVPRVVVISHWWVNLAPLPFKESDIVITGRVLTANAFLSNDRTNVYSEFSVQIQEVLSNCTNRSLGTTLDVNREGGSIRFPSGQILYRTTSRQVSACW